MKYRTERRTVGALLLLTCGLLGACASEAPVYRDAIQPSATRTSTTPELVQATLPRPAPVPEATSPLDYYQWAQSATPEELMSERERLSTYWITFEGAADPLVHTVHLGILMSLSASPDSEKEAMTLLATIDDPASVNADRREYAIFANFLRNHLEQRENLRLATSSVVESREELETLERNNQQLQEKIDALTSIEEQLIEREQAQGEN